MVGQDARPTGVTTRVTPTGIGRSCSASSTLILAQFLKCQQNLSNVLCNEGKNWDIYRFRLRDG